MFKRILDTKIDSESLLKEYPISFLDDRKQKIYDQAFNCLRDKARGEILINRVCFDEKTVEDGLVYSPTNIIAVDTFFEYAKDINTEDRKVWWMNFADPELFGFYDSSLFAQDEIQVFEHPLLANIRSFLSSKEERDFEPRTVVYTGKKNKATPYLIENVPLLFNVNTTPVLNDGFVGYIYGNRFSFATEEEIEAGIKICYEDIKNNILAIAAPRGSGLYKKFHIEQTLETLLCSFAAAKSFSKTAKCIIHGGNWGCGAFGGNQEFMYLAQVLAASIVEIDELVLHGVDRKVLERALSMFEELKTTSNYDSVVNKILDIGYMWGMSDGN